MSKNQPTLTAEQYIKIRSITVADDISTDLLRLFSIYVDQVEDPVIKRGLGSFLMQKI